jgi:hypothetical protein
MITSNAQHAPLTELLGEHDMIETSELGGRLALVDPKSLETEQRSLYDFIDQKFVPWSREANFAIKIDGGRYVGPFNTFL